MNYDFIKISRQEIAGLKNAGLIINGTITKKKYKFEVYANNQLKKNINFENHNDSFKLKCSLEKTDKVIETYVIIGKNKYLISKLKNTQFTRIKAKIRSMLFKMKIIFSTKEKAKIYYNPFDKIHYKKWLKNQPKVEIKKLNYNPLISIVIPVYNISSKLLKECLDSVLNQKYQNFEICIADDASTNQDTIRTLKEYEQKDNRIKVVYRKKNGHISEATNSAIEISKGEFVGFLDNDDLLAKDALYLVVEALNKNKKLDMIYTDEDKMDLDGKFCEPFFKPDFSPNTLLSFNYITHFAVYRKKILEKVGYLKSEYNGAQDFDLALRVTEVTNNIHHIPKIAYHWRKTEVSTALSMSAKDYALVAGQKVIEDALKRRNRLGSVSIPKHLAFYIVEYKYEKEPKISILIPTKDYAQILDKCLKSIYTKTEYKNYEVIVLNNSSVEEKTYELFRKYKKNHENFRVIDVDMEFNYAKINNIGVSSAKGEYVVLLNNDTEIITKKWLHYMVGYAMQENIGAVGAKLYYPDNTIQHCGVVLGIANIAGHIGVGHPRGTVGSYARFLVPYDCAAVTGACLMVSKKKYLEVSGLDEEFKVSFNDVVFNIELLKKGYYNVLLPQVELYHYESKSRGSDEEGEKLERFLKESKLLKEKEKEYIENDPFYNPNLSKKSAFMLDLPEKRKKRK